MVFAAAGEKQVNLCSGLTFTGVQLVIDPDQIDWYNQIQSEEDDNLRASDPDPALLYLRQFGGEE